MKINKEGYRIILTAVIIVVIIGGLLAYLTPYWLFAPLNLGLLIWLGLVIYFFREPKRELIQNEDIIYCPADGKIVVIEEVVETEFLGDKRIQVSVFMSPLNVHINWYPVSGSIEYFKYHPGKFLVAWHPKSSEENERTTTVVDTGTHKILFRQIAGYVARRIVSYVKVGERAEQNHKFGFIKFGSRIDLFLPLDSEILVNIGDKVTGSQTAIAKIKNVK